MLKLYKRKLYVIKATLKNIEEAILGFGYKSYREEIINGNYIEGFKTEKGLNYCIIDSKTEVKLPTTVEESEWLV